MSSITNSDIPSLFIGRTNHAGDRYKVFLNLTNTSSVSAQLDPALFSSRVLALLNSAQFNDSSTNPTNASDGWRPSYDQLETWKVLQARLKLNFPELAILSDDADKDADEISGNLPRLRSDSGNYHAYYSCQYD
ncbi:unnamed protein product [Protopolystoma xenopodis]|uniref:Uncharacterized protein n=1 Tax=Protopolystoma xenopodis TaxID=117903 RepID=A0A3S5CSJ3_9PLAT|nr:unnamed protein product [Protopolystoma xenopodis]